MMGWLLWLYLCCLERWSFSLTSVVTITFTERPLFCLFVFCFTGMFGWVTSSPPVTNKSYYISVHSILEILNKLHIRNVMIWCCVKNNIKFHAMSWTHNGHKCNILFFLRLEFEAYPPPTQQRRDIVSYSLTRKQHHSLISNYHKNVEKVEMHISVP